MGRPRIYPRPPCLVCQEPCKRATTKFCSPTCYGAYRHEHNISIGGPPRVNHVPLECPTCKKVWTPRRGKNNKEYCSRACWRGRPELLPGSKPREPKEPGKPRAPEQLEYFKQRGIPVAEVRGVHRDAVPADCPTCEETFLPNNCKLTQKYCSRRCAGLSRVDFVKAIGEEYRQTPVSQETRNKHSKIASERMANRTYTKGVGGTRDDLGRYFRSRWEANVARILEYEGIPYEYETQTFLLLKEDGTEVRYRPDFKLHDRWIEVKGWWDPRSKLIKQLMAEQYPSIQIEYIDEPPYKELKDYYGTRINFWERSY